MLLVRSKVLPSALCHRKQEGQCKEIQADMALDGRLAVWLSFFLSTRPPEHSDLPTLSCLPHSSWKEDTPAEGRYRVEQGAAHTDAAGQGHLLLLHILAQAPALSGGYMVRCFPDPNSECQARETGTVAPCGFAPENTHNL